MVNTMTYDELFEAVKQDAINRTLYDIVKILLLNGMSTHTIYSSVIQDYPYIDQIINQVQQDLSQQNTI